MGVCVSGPCPKIELLQAGHEAMDCWLVEWTEVGAVEEGVSLISRDCQVKIREAVLLVIRGKGVTAAEVEVKRNVAGGLGSESMKWELAVGGTQKLGGFKEV